MHVQRIYLDTSVIGGYFDDEFREKTRRLFDAFLRGEARMVLSTLTGSELLEAPKRVRDFIGDFPCEKEIMIDWLYLQLGAKLSWRSSISCRCVCSSSSTENVTSTTQLRSRSTSFR